MDDDIDYEAAAGSQSALGLDHLDPNARAAMFAHMICTLDAVRLYGQTVLAQCEQMLDTAIANGQIPLDAKKTYLEAIQVRFEQLNKTALQ
ncbi:MAG TPA: hypothetical protein PKL83_06395 [bacterium]|nr:hypothetical protein [bacterium]